MPEIVADRYVILEDKAISGGQSVVRKAVDTHTGNNVAVKFVNGPNDQTTKKIFQREVAALQALKHPNIVRLLASGVDETDTFYVVLDWIPESLLDILNSGTVYEWQKFSRYIALPLIDALAHAHLKQTEHRDIKPGNVLVDADGNPFLADFGIAKLRQDIDSDSELTVGNFRSGPYAPPEHDSSIPYVRDVYSMGVLIIQALHADRITDFSGVAPALESIRVPPDARALLESCVNVDRSLRPRNGSLLAEQFRSLLSSKEVAGVANRPVILLRLTNTARRNLTAGLQAPGEGDQAAAGILMRDLTGEVFADYQVDRETGRRDRETVEIVGQSWRIVAKAEERANYFTIIAAQKLEYEQLESRRRKYMPVSPVMLWQCGESRDRVAVRSGYDALIGSLDSFDDTRYVSRGSVGDNTLEIFDGWLRLLEAREELDRGEVRPLRYQNPINRDREADFDLLVGTEHDLLGLEFDVVIPESGKRVGRGEVIAVQEGTLTLRSRGNFNRLPKRGLLTPFLGPSQIAIQRQRDAVIAVKEGTCARADLGTLLSQPGTCAIPVAREVPEWTQTIDSSKKQAVKLALGSPDALVVQGPPGTGKTTLITELVAQQLRANPTSRILLVSQTHVAVDNSLERLDNAGIERMTRLGADDARVNPAVRHLLLDQQMARWASDLQKKAQKYLESRSADSGISTRHLNAALCLQQLSSTLKELTHVQRYVDPDDPSPHSDLQTSMDEHNGAGTLQARLDRLTEYRDELRTEAEAWLAGDLTLRATITVEEVDAAVEILVGDSGAGRELLQLLSLQAEWLQRVASDRNLERAFLNTTQVIAGTCIGFLQNAAVRELDIDLCILDEASKATATEALVPMARSKRWVLIGDTKQLPPVDEDLLRSPALMEEHDLDEEFVTQTLFGRLTELLPRHSSIALMDQYRMIRPIGDLVSTCFYDGELNSPITDGLKGYDILGKPVVWIDTGHLGERRREDAPSGAETSFANRSEASLVAERAVTIDRAISRGLIKLPSNKTKLDLLVIAPYTRQTDELKRRLAQVSLPHLDYSVYSIDAVQGREADLAILSVTRSNAEGRLGFLGPAYWRRINVALSRARFGLTIVGDADFCSSQAGALKLVADYIRSHASDCEMRRVVK